MQRSKTKKIKLTKSCRRQSHHRTTPTRRRLHRKGCQRIFARHQELGSRRVCLRREAHLCGRHRRSHRRQDQNRIQSVEPLQIQVGSRYSRRFGQHSHCTWQEGALPRCCQRHFSLPRRRSRRAGQSQISSRSHSACNSQHEPMLSLFSRPVSFTLSSSPTDQAETSSTWPRSAQMWFVRVLFPSFFALRTKQKF